jgi:hypothetical protein
MKILKFFIALWLGSALIGFIVNPMVGTYILFLPTMPFVEMSSTFSYNARVQKNREFILKHSSLLTKEQGVRAAKRICNLEHLGKEKTNYVLANYAKPFCELEEDDKVFFYKDCVDYGWAYGRDLSTGYILVRDDKPIARIHIEASDVVRIIKDGNKTNYYNRHIPIVEQLH